MPANAGSFLNVLSPNHMETQTTYKDYANFNSFTVAGRILNSELASGKNGEFLAVTVITHGLTDDEGMTVTFNDSNGLMSLFKDGWLPSGRMVTLTGHIAYVSETYTDERTKEVKLLKRPRIHLVDAAIPTGGLGPLPKAKVPQRRVGATVVRPSDATKPAVEEAPAF